MLYGIKAKSIYCENRILENATIIIENGSIKKVLEEHEENDVENVIDLSEYSIIPGLIDLHVHGANGYDTMDSNLHSLNEVSKYLASRGITSFLPTTVTEEVKKIKQALINISCCMNKVEGAEILGSYIEGPYICKEHKGAHAEHLIKDLNLKELQELIEVSKHTVKVITIAPEKKNAYECIKYLTLNNIQVSMGHTNATYDEAAGAIDSGAKVAVHTFNGMRGFNHREPGILGAVLTKDDVYCELICDLVHVHPAAVDLLLRCKDKEKVILISDGIQASGLQDGEYMLGALKVNVKCSIARVESGSLAGSTTDILTCVKNIIEKVGVEPLEAINMASFNPSKLLNIDKLIGSIREGKKANLVIIDDNFNVVKTLINGKEVFTR